jgi:hypothetical protein
MSKDLEVKIKFLENEFNFYYKELRGVSRYIFDMYHVGDPDYTDEDDLKYSEYWTHEYFQRMYTILCVYFELLQLNDFLKTFKLQYEDIVKNQKKCIEIASIPLTYGDFDDDFNLLIEWQKFLAPFSFFWNKQNDSKESKKINDILESTNEILKLTKTKVTKEEDINTIIRDIFDLYYTDVSSYSQGYFRHKFKHYKPDVIIGELGISIEYKLIRVNKEIGVKIDELIIDANRYTGNIFNKKCIAVFCLSKKVTKTKKQISEEWNKSDFPNNWELIIINDVEIT